MNKLTLPGPAKLKRSFQHQNYALFVQFYKYMVVKNLAPTTISGYKHTVADYIEFIRGEDLTALSHLPIRAYLIARHRRGTSYQTIHRDLAALTSFFEFLRREGLIAINPVRRIRKPKLSRKLISPPSEKEVVRLLNFVSKLKHRTAVRDYCLMELFYSSGIRCGELCKIHVDDINFEDGSIFIWGKGKRQRQAFFVDKAGQAMREYLRGRTIGPLFQSMRRYGNRLSERAVRLVVKTLCTQAGMPEMHPHLFRHAFATHLAPKINLRELQELMGHQSISTTTKYIAESPDNLKKVIRKFHPRG
jgi:site-specific recombinase XerD